MLALLARPNILFLTRYDVCAPFVCIQRVVMEKTIMQTTTEKQRTNIILTVANLAVARELGLNVSAISERRTWIEANGTPLEDLQVLKVN